jgi:hypothetical protein
MEEIDTSQGVIYENVAIKAREVIQQRKQN